MPVLYVLSVGPAIFFFEQSGRPQAMETFFTYFYAPLEWLHSNVREVRHLLDWYIELFD